jgi:hypothetical protein
MKRKIVLVAAGSLPLLSMAQAGKNINSFREEYVTIPATLLAVITLVVFILSFLKTILNYRLRLRLIEKGAPEKVLESFQQAAETETKRNIIKWAIILTGGGVGLLIVKYTAPLGIHSLAILAFSIAASFMIYFFCLKKIQ